LILTSGLFACGRDVDKDTQADNSAEWSDKEEVIYQLKEVIRFEEMQASLRQEQLEEIHQATDSEPADKP
jgi:hypothetical protein